MSVARLVVAEQSAVTDAIRWLRGAMPRVLQRLLFVSPEMVRFPANAPPARSGPICLALDEKLILRRRLSLPGRAKRHLGGAVRLLVETETPFSIDEVLLHAQQLKAAPAISEVSYELRIVSRATIADAIKELRISPRRLVRITEAGAGEQLDFWPAAFPTRRVLRWLPLLPLAILAASIGALAYQVSSEQRAEITALEAAAASKLGQLRSIADQIDALRQNMAGEHSVSQALATSPSAFVAMQDVRERLPEDAQLVRLQLQHGELRLALKGPDLLKTSQQLAAPSTSPPWSSGIDGPITVDAGSGLEQATVLLRWTPAGGAD